MFRFESYKNLIPQNICAKTNSATEIEEEEGSSEVQLALDDGTGVKEALTNLSGKKQESVGVDELPARPRPLGPVAEDKIIPGEKS